MPDHLPFDYLIITHDSLVNAFDELVRWKNQKGVRTRVAPLSEVYSKHQQYGRPEANIKLYIKDCYKNHNIKYVLLGADHPIIPAVGIFHDIESSGYTDSIAPSDLYYACFDNDILWDKNGNGRLAEPDDDIDIYPEVIISRIPARNKLEVNSMVKKILYYERNPPQTNYVKSIAMCGNILTQADYQTGKCDALIMSENNYYKNIRPYWDGNIITMFHDGFKSQYAFTNDNILKLFNGEMHNNSGPHIIDVRTHGGYYFYASFNPKGSTIFAKNLYDTSYVSKQTNINQSIFISSACFVNAFDNNETRNLSSILLFAEHGALSYIGSTRYGLFSHYNEVSRSLLYEHHLYNNLFNYNQVNYQPNIGYIHQRALFSLYPININSYSPNRYLFMSISLMGDPEMPIYTEDPTPFDVSINIDETLGYVVKVNGESVEDEVLTISDGKREPSLQLNLQDTYEANYTDTTDIIIITVVGRNKVPYIFEPTTFKTLHIREREIDVSKEYWADDVIIGENVTVKTGVKLIIHAKNSIKMLDNVKAEEGATVQIGFN